MKQPPIKSAHNRAVRPTPSTYIDDLRQEFPHLDLTDEQATAILEPLFEIMAMHVRMGFGLEPVGKLIEAFESSTSEGRILVNSHYTGKDAQYE